MVSHVPGLSRLPAAIAIAAALLFGLPAVASAADTYADASAADNSGDCLTPATACQTIGGVDGALSKSGPGDTTFVADGAYAESVVLDGGRSLVSLDDTDPKPVIDSGGTTTITVDSSGAGTVSGLQVLSSYSAIEVNGTVTIEDNAFDENPTSNRPVVAVESGSSVVIRNNVFVDPDATGYSIGVFLSTSDLPAAVVSDNTFDGLGLGVIAVGGDAQISGNQFSGAHPLPSSGLPGAGILVGSGQPMIEHNTIGAPSEDPSAGILVLRQGPGDPSVGATLSRNRISGNDVGVQVIDADLPVTLSNDLIHDNTIGLESTDSSADTPPSTQGDVSATNATIVDNGTDVALSFTTLTLDSSIVDDPIDLEGTGACDITYSRGPADLVGNGCDAFDTSADPQFVDPLTGDYHLQSASALIDVGNPADPGPGAVDFYGDPRMVQGKACGAVRRDIGADEFNPGSPPQCAQDTYADTSRPDDNGDCLSPATACKTIAAAIAKSADSQTTFVADGTYAESLTLGQGRSLESLDPSDPRPIVDNGAASAPAIAIGNSGAGTVSGFRVRSDFSPMRINGTVTVEDNVFDESSVPSFSGGDVDLFEGGSVVITDNQFVDPNATGFHFGIQSDADETPAPVISDNTFTDLAGGVVLTDGDPQISGNQFTGIRVIGVTPIGTFPGAGVLVIGGLPTIEQNIFGPATEHPVVGVYINPPAPIFSAGATLSRNRIFGNDVGVQVVDSNSPVTLSNDLIYGNTTGLESTDSSADSPTPSTQGDVSATNTTIFDNAVDVQLSYTTATLNSTIIGTTVDMVGNGACSISYSRGPSTPNGNGCGNFATSAAPQFVDAAGGDYHLQSTSELIDVGDPASPGGGVVDFYGGPRAVQGKACSSARRDIGADEYDPPTLPDCPPPPEPPAPTPTADPPATKIDKRPDKQSSDRSPTFDFSSDVAGSSFRCRLDNRAWKPCAPPVTYHGLRFGKHRFRVYAKGPTGVRGNTRVFRFAVIKGE